MLDAIHGNALSVAAHAVVAEYLALHSDNVHLGQKAASFLPLDPFELDYLDHQGRHATRSIAEASAIVALSAAAYAVVNGGDPVDPETYQTARAYAGIVHGEDIDVGLEEIWGDTINIVAPRVDLIKRVALCMLAGGGRLTEGEFRNIVHGNN